jgi:predicted RecA/RadA family phage recombinase
MPLQLQEGRVIDVVLTGSATAGQIAPLAECAGVYLGSGTSGQTVPVGLEGVFEVPKKAGATLDFAVGEYVQTLTTGGVEKAVATGGSKPLGIAVAAAATGATTVRVKVERW